MGNVIRIEKYKEGKSTLQEMYEEITEGIFPFITLNIIDRNGKCLISNTIPFARFRELEDRPSLWEIRSSDEVSAKSCFVSKDSLKDYVLTHQESLIHYVFQCTIS